MKVELPAPPDVEVISLAREKQRRGEVETLRARVTELEQELSVAPTTIEKTPRFFAGRCRHRGVVIDADLRTVSCKACETTLDPVSVLIEYAEYERRFQNQADARAALIKEIEKLSKERAHLGRGASRLRELHAGVEYAIAVLSKGDSLAARGALLERLLKIAGKAP